MVDRCDSKSTSKSRAGTAESANALRPATRVSATEPNPPPSGVELRIVTTPMNREFSSLPKKRSILVILCNRPAHKATPGGPSDDDVLDRPGPGPCD